MKGKLLPYSAGGDIDGSDKTPDHRGKAEGRGRGMNMGTGVGRVIKWDDEWDRKARVNYVPCRTVEGNLQA